MDNFYQRLLMVHILIIYSLFILVGGLSLAFQLLFIACFFTGMGDVIYGLLSKIKQFIRRKDNE